MKNTKIFLIILLEKQQGALELQKLDAAMWDKYYNYRGM